MTCLSARWRYAVLLVGMFSACHCEADADRMAHMRLEPQGVLGQVEPVSRNWYALGYSPQKRQPLWVAYRIKRTDTCKAVERKDNFRPDPNVSNSPSRWDYYGTGFDRGHMAPANDMLYRFEAMDDSFYMSNMSPQYYHVNRGIWERIESFVHDVAKRLGEIWVVSGPIFADKGGPFAEIPIPGEDEVIKTQGGDIAVPVAFFKVLYTPARGGMTLAFIVPNTKDDTSNWRIYARSVRIAEVLTGVRFFPNVDDVDRNMDLTRWID